MFTRRFLTDLAERVAATFAIGFLTAWLAAPALNVTDVGAWRAAGLAGLAAAGSVLKGLVASRVGDRGSAALLPAEPRLGD